MDTIERDAWYIIKTPMHMRLDSVYKYAKTHSKERSMWVLKCFSPKGVDWVSYTEENLLYSLKKGFIAEASPSEILDATIMESKLRK